jgi:hypothetical protein
VATGVDTQLNFSNPLEFVYIQMKKLSYVNLHFMCPSHMICPPLRIVSGSATGGNNDLDYHLWTASVGEQAKYLDIFHLDATHGYISYNIIISTTGKSGAAVLPIIAVRHRTAKTSLPCVARGTPGKEYVHGKDTWWRTAKIQSTATSPVPHGKVPPTRTAKK